MNALDGKAVLVTGAGRGLGRAYALEAGGQGALVMVNDVDGEAAATVVGEILAAGGVAAAAPGTIASWPGADAAVEATVRAFGKIDGLVNNAGLFSAGEPWEAAEADVRQLLEVNLLGTAFCGIQAMRRMREGDGGAIVNVTSGAQLGAPRLSLYAASKAAVTGLTYGWAIDGIGAGIRVNAISPSADTAMGRDGLQGMRMELPDPASNAAAVVFLLSDLAAAVTGQIVRSGGRRLGLLARAQPLPAVEAAGARFTVEEVAAAFSGPLRRWLQPVGALATTYAEPARP